MGSQRTTFAAGGCVPVAVLRFVNREFMGVCAILYGTTPNFDHDAIPQDGFRLVFVLRFSQAAIRPFDRAAVRPPLAFPYFTVLRLRRPVRRPACRALDPAGDVLTVVTPAGA